MFIHLVINGKTQVNNKKPCISRITICNITYYIRYQFVTICNITYYKNGYYYNLFVIPQMHIINIAIGYDFYYQFLEIIMSFDNWNKFVKDTLVELEARKKKTVANNKKSNKENDPKRKSK